MPATPVRLKPFFARILRRMGGIPSAARATAPFLFWKTRLPEMEHVMGGGYEDREGKGMIEDERGKEGSEGSVQVRRHPSWERKKRVVYSSRGVVCCARLSGTSRQGAFHKAPRTARRNNLLSAPGAVAAMTMSRRARGRRKRRFEEEAIALLQMCFTITRDCQTRRIYSTVLKCSN